MLNYISNDTLIREIRKLSKEDDEFHLGTLVHISFVSTTEVWTSESGEGFSSFAICFIDNGWLLRSATLSCSLLVGRHTRLELPEMFIKVMRMFKIEKNHL